MQFIANPLSACPVARVVLCVWTLSACSLGPNYKAPGPVTANHFNAMEGDAVSKPHESATNPQWWTTFQDPQLNSLISQAIAGNLSLQQAVMRIASSRQQIDQARGAWFPGVTAKGQVTRQQPGIEGLLKSNGAYDQIEQNATQYHATLDTLTKPVTLYQGNFDTSWELDLWGRVRRQVEVATAQQQQKIESRNDVLVSLEAEVARTYLQLRGAQAIMQIIETQVQLAQQTLQLTQSQQRNGLSPMTDVENARALLASLRALLPQYQSQVRQAMNGMSVLLGKAPGMLDNQLAALKALPRLPALVSIGVPSMLARRRPDVRVAEARLHAATANIGVSIAQIFPSLSLTGEFGMRNTDASYLDNWSSHFYSFGPSLSIPVFQGGRLVSSVKLARAEQANAALNYRQTVLTALQEVENALVSYHADQQRVESLDETVEAQQNTFNLARDSYRQGLSSFILVLDAQRQLAETRLQLVAARMQSSIDLVALYKSLGGGWEPYQNVDLPVFSVFGDAIQG